MKSLKMLVDLKIEEYLFYNQFGNLNEVDEFFDNFK